MFVYKWISSKNISVDQTPSPDIQEIDDWSSSSDDHDQEDIVEDDVDDIHDDINTIKTITPEVKSSEYDCFQVHQRGILQHQKQDNINEVCWYFMADLTCFALTFLLISGRKQKPKLMLAKLC